MGENPLEKSTEKAYLPLASPPRNHGHTKAAWVTVVIVIVGSVVAALGVMAGEAWVFWVGIGVVVLGGVVGWALRMLGLGQPETTTRRRGSRDADA